MEAKKMILSKRFWEAFQIGLKKTSKDDGKIYTSDPCCSME